MSELRYRPIHHDALAPGECVVEPSLESPSRWLLWFCFTRTTDGKTERRWIPVLPNEDAPNGRAGWGLRRAGADRWQIAPSIKCLESRDHDGADDVEVWHETPMLVEVPDGLPWQNGARA